MKLNDKELMAMMLSDKELKEVVIKHQLVYPFNPDNCKGATIDLTLDSKVKRYISDKEIVMGEKIQPEQFEEIDISTKPFSLQPNESILVQSVESIKVPENMSALAFEKDSIKLLGLSISPASYMSPGYKGTPTFVAYNQAPKPIRLVPGIKFAQLGLFKLSSASHHSYEKKDVKYTDHTDENNEKHVINIRDHYGQVNFGLDTSQVHTTKMSYFPYEISQASNLKLHLDHKIKEFLKQNGIRNITNEEVKKLSENLMKRIQRSSKRIADELRVKLGDPDK